MLNLISTITIVVVVVVILAYSQRCSGWLQEFSLYMQHGLISRINDMRCGEKLRLAFTCLKPTLLLFPGLIHRNDSSEPVRKNL